MIVKSWGYLHHIEYCILQVLLFFVVVFNSYFIAFGEKAPADIITKWKFYKIIE